MENNNKNNISNNNNKNNIGISKISNENSKELPINTENLNQESQPAHDVIVINVINPITLPEKIVCFLYDNPEKTIKEISEYLKEDENKIRTTIQRNKDIFQEVGNKSKAIIYSIFKEKREEVNLKINQLKKKKENELEYRLKLKLEKKNNEEIIESLKILIQNKQIFKREEDNIFISLLKLSETDIDIFSQLESDPEKTLQLIEASFNELGFKKIRYIDWDNIFQKKTVENLRADDLNKLIYIEVKSSSISNIKPQVVNAEFECPSCGTVISVLQIEKKFREPTRCSCGRKGNFRLTNKLFTNAAKIILEDFQENSISSSIKNVTGFLKGDLKSKDMVNYEPGNDLKVLGILREIPILLPNGSISTRFDWGLDIISIEPFNPEIKIENFSEQELEEFKEISSEYEEKGFQEIRKSIAPYIHGNDEIKDAIIIQASQPRNNPKDPRNIRFKSNILIISNPGTSKTQLMNFAGLISSNYRSCSGSGSSQVGLTASVENQDDFGWTAKPGVLCLAKDLVGIDELNQIEEEERKKLQQGLNEMKIELNKASVHKNLPVTCGVFSCANPIRGKFDINQPMIPQFNLFPPIMNRFDYIFVIKDEANSEKDCEIAKSVINRFRDKIELNYPIEFLKKYFVFIKNQPEPVYDDEITEYISKLYSSIRQSKKLDNNEQVNARFVETLIRGSQASARLRLSDKVEKKDVERIYEIIKKTYLEIIKEANLF